MTAAIRPFCFIIAVLAWSSPSWAQFVDSNLYYRLSTQFRGVGMALDVFNGGPKNNMTHLARSQDVSGQHWQFRPARNGYYRLTTLFRGESMCLDVFNGGRKNDQVHLTRCANYSGQFWRIVNAGKWIHLTSQFRGDGMCLDIFNGGPDNNQPHLAPCTNASGQNWKLYPTNRRVDQRPNGRPPIANSPKRPAAKQSKTKKYRVGSCAYWKDQWRRSGSRGAYRKMSDACDDVARKSCGKNGYRSGSGTCRCKRNYERRQGKCFWKVDSKGFEVAPWKKPGCKTWQRQCDNGIAAACRKHEATCQVN
ncbi:MAG: RICIN domain-containing protein [Hyphomicrobiaceae bacterium]